MDPLADSWFVWCIFSNSNIHCFVCVSYVNSFVSLFINIRLFCAYAPTNTIGSLACNNFKFLQAVFRKSYSK